MKTSTENKWIATLLIVSVAIAAIVVIEGTPKARTMPLPQTDTTIYVLPKVAEMKRNTNPFSL